MDSQLQVGQLEVGQPQENVVSFLVDGVAFDLDISALEPMAQRHYEKVTRRGDPYEPVMTRCLTKLLRHMEEPQFMDIGGFAGYYTCYVATLLGPGSKPVYTIESNPAYCRQMERSCELNGLRNVRIFEAVLSDSAEPAKVGADGFSVIFGSAQAGETTAITLDRLCEREPIPAPDIIKMDIHGSEGKALFGMTSVLASAETLLLELHTHDRLEVFSPGVERPDIMNLLWDQGMSVYYIAGHRARDERKSRDCITSGRFAYRRVTPDNVDFLFFDRIAADMFLLATRRDDIEAILGDSLDDRYLCY